MKSIVFLVNTEYHVLLSLGIICRYFPNDYHIVIYRHSPVAGKRLNHLSFSGTGIEYRELISDYAHPNNDIWKLLDEIVDRQPQQFFFFNEYRKDWANYLFAKLHEKGTKIILGPDGMKVYGNKPIPVKTMLKNATKTFLFALRSHTSPTKVGPYFIRHYASSKYIDEVWMECPEYYKNFSKKKVVEFHLPSPDDNNYLCLLNSVFMVKLDDVSPLKDKVILFLDSPIRKDCYLPQTVNILKTVRQKYPDRRLLVKPHQLSTPKALKTYQTLSNVSIIESRYPAELYIANAIDAIVISLISTSLLFYNPNCRYYWTYPLFEELYNDWYKDISNPTKHIKVVTDASQI